MTIKTPASMRCLALLLSLLVAVVAGAQTVEYFDARNEPTVIPFECDGFLCTHWGGPQSNISGPIDREAVNVYVPDSIEFRSRNYRSAELSPGCFKGMNRMERCSFNVGLILVDAFTGCTNLRVLESRSPVPPMVGVHVFYYGEPDEVFEDYHFLTAALVVPPGSEQAYRSAPGWKQFHTIVSREPKADDYDLAAIAVAIDSLTVERDSLVALSERLSHALAAPAVAEAQTSLALPPRAAVADANASKEFEPLDTVEHVVKRAIKIKSNDGFVYKSRFISELNIVTHNDATAVRLTIPDMAFANGKYYPVTTMMQRAFSCFRHLMFVSLPSELRNVPAEAFAGCDALRVLEMRSSVPPAMESIDDGEVDPGDVFSDSQFADVVLVVPPDSESAYRQARGWGRFAHIVTAMPTLGELGITADDVRRMETDAQLTRVDARLQRVDTVLGVLRGALNHP